MNTKREEQKVPLGSGYNYILLDDGSYDTSTPEGRFSLAKALFKEDQKWGYTYNGATVNYSPSFQNLKDDMGERTRNQLTEENLELQLGHFTTGPDILGPLVPTAIISDVPGKEGVKEISFGGINNDTGKDYFFGFHHPDPIDGDTYFVTKGRNTGDLSIQWSKDGVGGPQATITATAMDSSGRLYFEYDVDPGVDLFGEGE